MHGGHLQEGEPRPEGHLPTDGPMRSLCSEPLIPGTGTTRAPFLRSTLDQVPLQEMNLHPDSRMTDYCLLSPFLSNDQQGVLVVEVHPPATAS